MSAEYRIGDVRDRLTEIPDGSIDLICTSPPFLALRSYLPADHPDKAREIGAEGSPAGFLGTLLRLTDEFGRVLAPHGSIAVELGDTYSGDGTSQGGANSYRAHVGGRRDEGGATRALRSKTAAAWPLTKSLCGIPTLYPWSLAYGRNLLDPEQTVDRWRIRNLLVWARANPPVGALGDKWRPATSYITVACKGPKRWFDLDAVRQPASPNSHARTAKGVTARANDTKSGHDDRTGGNRSSLDILHSTDGAPPLDWWSDIDDGPNGDRLWWLNTQPYGGAHYATFPEELPRRIIECMCPSEVCTTCGTPRVREVESQRVRRADAVRETLGWSTCDCPAPTYRPGIVLDPFAGSGTTLAVAVGLGRAAIGIDLDPRNIDLARERCGMFLEVAS